MQPWVKTPRRVVRLRRTAQRTEPWMASRWTTAQTAGWAAAAPTRVETHTHTHTSSLSLSLSPHVTFRSTSLSLLTLMIYLNRCVRRSEDPGATRGQELAGVVARRLRAPLRRLPGHSAQQRQPQALVLFRDRSTCTHNQNTPALYACSGHLCSLLQTGWTTHTFSSVMKFAPTRRTRRFCAMTSRTDSNQ